jgi:hypothetical protein
MINIVPMPPNPMLEQPASEDHPGINGAAISLSRSAHQQAQPQRSLPPPGGDDTLSNAARQIAQ